MTISTTDSSIAYSGNGVTLAFAVPFRFLVDADLTVTLRSTAGVESTLVLNTNYTLTGANDDAGGTLTMVVAPAVGERLVIERIVGITQETDYPEGSNFPAEAHERALDRLTMIGQQLLRSISRCFQLPTSSTGNPVISSSASLANKFLTFDASENLTVAAGTALSGVIVTPLAETLVGRATAALMRGDLGAGATGDALFTSTTDVSARTLLAAPSRNEVVTQTWTAFTTAGTSTAYTLAPTTWGGAYISGVSFFITFHASSGNNPTLTIAGVASPPNLVKMLADGSFVNIQTGEITTNHRSRVTLLSPTQALVESLPSGSLDYATLTTSANNDTTAAFGTFSANTSRNITVNASTGQITLTPGMYQITAHVVPISGFSGGETVQRGLRFNRVSGTTFLPSAGILYSGQQYLLISGATGEGWTLVGSLGVSATAVYSLNATGSTGGKFLRCEYITVIRY